MQRLAPLLAIGFALLIGGALVLGGVFYLAPAGAGWRAAKASREERAKTAARAQLLGTLADSSSFEEVEWLPVSEIAGPSGELYLTVALRYRVKNSSGTMVTNQTGFLLDHNLAVKEVGHGGDWAERFKAHVEQGVK